MSKQDDFIFVDIGLSDDRMQVGSRAKDSRTRSGKRESETESRCWNSTAVEEEPH